jgi:hypothetical protein
MAAKTIKRDRKQEELDNLWDNRRYRFRQLLGEEWPNDDIEALAKGTVHPTELEKMLAQGCQPRTAVRILI